MENEKNLVLDIDDIKNALNLLKKSQTKKFINLGGNIFSVDHILTCFNVDKFIKNHFESFDNYFFKFSYDDGNVKSIFNVICNLEDDTSYGFLKTSTFMDYDQLCMLVSKVIETVSKSGEFNIGSLSNDLYNEALIFVTSGINKEECKQIKDDFESKFKIYQEKQNEKNKEIKLYIKKLYDEIIKLKNR